MGYSEIFGDIIINDILNLHELYEIENDQLILDCAGIHICKKEDMLNIINNKSITIMYYYSYVLKDLAKQLNKLYKDKLTNKEKTIEEYNNEIKNIREEIKKELLKNSKNFNVNVKLKTVIYPKEFVNKVKIAIKIINGEEIKEEYKLENSPRILLSQVIRQLKNFINNIIHFKI